MNDIVIQVITWVVEWFTFYLEFLTVYCREDEPFYTCLPFFKKNAFRDHDVLTTKTFYGSYHNLSKLLKILFLGLEKK